MTSVDKLFRRNLIIAGVMHGLLILGVLVCDRWSTHRSEVAVPVEVFLPADILGDMPKGRGYGRGAYAPAPPAGGGGGAPEAPAGPSAQSFTPEESPAPTAPAPAHPEPGEVYLPKKDKETAKAKKPAPSASVGKATMKNAAAVVTAKPAKSTTAAKAVNSTAKSTGGSGTGTGSGKGPGTSAKDIRNLFASALKAAPGGTPYGDGRAPGGGNGSSSVIGSPNGSPDGIVGGVGPGSPFWWYYQHVHDRMYEAWQQPGEAVKYDKKLVAVIRLRVARDGTILEAKLVGGSGNKIMDDSALQAARGVSQLKPLPEGLGTLTADITVNFRLEG